MTDIKLFHITPDGVDELSGGSVHLEKELQTLIERYLPEFLGVRFLASEYSTGKTHSGRIDTLGIDENGFPVIIEYKRSSNENIINQGLFYMDWLLDHKAEFELLVIKQLGNEVAENIEWSNPRLLCIAGDFTKYDEHAVQQINRTIELIRYRNYGEELLLLELVNAVTPQTTPDKGSTSSSRTSYKTVTESLEQASKPLSNLFDDVEAFITTLGDDVQKKTLKLYFAYKRIKNFVCIEVHTQQLLIFLKVNPDSITLEEGFSRDVRSVGHFGTGDLELRISSYEDFEKAKPLIIASYEAS
jgi:predicted transport protein